MLLALSEIESLHIKLHAAHLLTASHFFSNQTVIGIAACSPERVDIKYTWMSSPLYQDMINLVVYLIAKCTSEFMNVAM
jgi:hypothetical protein